MITSPKRSLPRISMVPSNQSFPRISEIRPRITETVGDERPPESLTADTPDPTIRLTKTFKDIAKYQVLKPFCCMQGPLKADKAVKKICKHLRDKEVGYRARNTITMTVTGNFVSGQVEFEIATSDIQRFDKIYNEDIVPKMRKWGVTFDDDETTN